jgi:4-hydroxybenzoate polyprenyltransferase
MQWWINLLLIIGLIQQLGSFYYTGVAVAFGLSVYQQKLIVNRDKTLCFKAFINSNYFGLAVFAGLVLDYLVNT